MIKHGLIIVLSIFISACGTVQYVVSRDIPQNPSFTVVPLYQKYRDIEYAANMEKVMIDLGISVVKTKKTATYIAITDSRNSIIKIIKKDTGEVLAVLDNIRDPKFKDRKIRNALKALGFNLREKK